MAWALILGAGILTMPESPRFAYGAGKVDEARRTMSRLYGVDSHCPLIDSEIAAIEEKLQEEKSAGKAGFFEIFTAPGMLHRTLVGMILQAGQQLTGTPRCYFCFLFSGRSTYCS